VARTLITDISHFLNEDGDLSLDYGPARNLAEHLTAIIAMVSHPSPTPIEFAVFCRRRPNRIQCKGQIEGGIDPDTGTIIWWCPECADTGFISNWQDTFWDLSYADVMH
jgi:hypothetical protein